MVAAPTREPNRLRRMGRVMVAAVLVAVGVGWEGSPPVAHAAGVTPLVCGVYQKKIAYPRDGDHFPSPWPNAWGITAGHSSRATVTAGGDVIDYDVSEARWFCVFEVDPVETDIVSATLDFWVDRFVSPHAAERMTVFDVTTSVDTLAAGNKNRPDIFEDLGSGVVYGTKLFECDGVHHICQSVKDELVSIPLNASMIEMLHDGGTIAVGVAMTSVRYPVDKCWRTDWDDGPTNKPVLCHDEKMGGVPVVPSLSWVEKRVQVDARARVGTSGPFTGNDVYEDGMFPPSVLGAAAPGEAETFEVSVQNDGNVKDRFTVTGEPAPPGYRVRYRYGETDITAAMTGAGWTSPDIRPRKAAKITVRFSPLASTSTGLRSRVLVRATSVDDPSLADKVVLFLDVATAP